MKDVPAERRQRVAESLISGDVCEKLLTNKQVPQDKMKSSCMDLLGKSKKNDNIGQYTHYKTLIICIEILIQGPIMTSSVQLYWLKSLSIWI